MSKVPGAARVSRRIRAVRQELRASLKQLHGQAAKLLAKGNYSAAQALVDVAQNLKAFDTDVQVLGDKWIAVRGGSKSASPEATPLWSYYKPILRAIAANEGRMSTPQLLVTLEPIVRSSFQAADLETASSGKPRWQVMVRKARKPMVKEGFLEAGSGQVWRITSAGQRAAANDAQK